MCFKCASSFVEFIFFIIVFIFLFFSLFPSTKNGGPLKLPFHSTLPEMSIPIALHVKVTMNSSSVPSIFVALHVNPSGNPNLLQKNVSNTTFLIWVAGSCDGPVCDGPGSGGSPDCASCGGGGNGSLFGKYLAHSPFEAESNFAAGVQILSALCTPEPVSILHTECSFAPLSKNISFVFIIFVPLV